MRSNRSIYGAWNEKNDEYGIKREKHAKMYYDQVRNRNRKMQVTRVAQNSGFPVSDIEKIFDHIFINEHELHGGLKRFDPSYDMAESWRRLSEMNGQHIQDHDLIMLHHELGEFHLMKQGLSYEEAHTKINKKFNYYEALKVWQRNRGDL
ncbi:TPA: hypothetical protein TXJ05_000611 [Streptococcus suis]|nr:hypothetical protein [Streptococcus suis]